MNKEFGRVFRLLFAPFLLGLLTAAFCVIGQAAEPPIPRPVGYVNDFAQVIEPDWAERITAVCRELDEKTGTEITVATFPDIGDGSIDDFTSRVFEDWMPGEKGIDNGILILDAIAQRLIRIEIGYGLEPVVPDAVAGRIRRDVMTPFLKAGQRGEAYYQGVAALATIVAKEENIELESLKGQITPEPQTQRRSGRGISPFVIFIAIAVLASIFRGGGRGGRGIRGGGPFLGGMFLGGGGFGGGGGGGGFGGFGGGMSGGGGSSGGY